MRYIKVLLLAVFLFLAMVFFFQNQAPLSQIIELDLNLFFIPAFKSIPLPFYFIVIAAFLVGCILTWLMLIWDRFTISARAMRRQWKINELEKKVANLQSQAAQEAKVFAEAEVKDQKNALPPIDEKKPA